MRRGDVVTAVFAGAYGKPRPALLLKDDAFEALPSATVLPSRVISATCPRSASTSLLVRRAASGEPPRSWWTRSRRSHVRSWGNGWAPFG
jgi:mRNA-degrading endonuclease toxin of MazEF toxin-antitoxin module